MRKWFLLFLLLSGNAFGGYPGWLYKRTLTDTAATGVTAYQIRVALTPANFNFAHAEANGTDIRFWDATANTALPFWIERWDDTPGSESAVIWVKVVDMTNTVELYHGKTGVLSGSSGENTFIRFASLMGSGVGPTIPNAANALSTPTYDGGNEVVHPGIVDFGVGQSWNGYRYWMCYAPYTANNNTLENPSIVVSNDGTTWTVPPGLTNPLWPAEAGRTQSDPDLVYDPVSNKLRCYWNKEDTSTYIYSRVLMLESSNGITWTGQGGSNYPYITMEWNPNPQNLATMQTIRGLSPSVVRVSANEWYMWTVIPLPGPYSVYRQTSTDGYTWNTPMVYCNLNYTGLNSNTLSTCWHHDVVKHTDGLYYMLMFSGEYGLSLAQSADGLNWSNSPGYAMGVKPLGNFDDGQLYRSTFLIDEAANKMRIWYTARNHSQNNPLAWHMGYTEASWSRLKATIDGNEPTYVLANTDDLVTGVDGLTLRQARRYTAYEIAAPKTRPDNSISLPGFSQVPAAIEVDIYDSWGDQTGIVDLTQLPCLVALRVGDTANLGATEGQQYEVGVGLAPVFTGAYATYHLCHSRSYSNTPVSWSAAGHGAQIQLKRAVKWRTYSIVVYGDGSSSCHVGGVGNTSLAEDRSWLLDYNTSNGVTGVRSIRVCTSNYNIPNSVMWGWKVRNLRARKFQTTEPAITVGVEQALSASNAVIREGDTGRTALGNDGIAPLH